MKFVDEAVISVTAGKGGDGCLSFHREKFVPKGGPDGGNGGEGGNVYLIADPNINTLVDFRHQRIFQAQNGQPGMGRNCAGKAGEDLYILVPLGTQVIVTETEECIADLTHAGQISLVASGGRGGIGNACFKSSTNRAPRKITRGTLGETRELQLSLQVLADVGLLGLPNAGKSTFIRSVSAATPKVADYPFTTLHPHLGVVRLGPDRSFVIADIPGLIEGASSGAGLGIQFLKHLKRTRLLLHLIEVLPADLENPFDALKIIEKELSEFSEELVSKTRWIVFTKIDCLSQEDLLEFKKKAIKKRGKSHPVFFISAISREGIIELCNALMHTLRGEMELYDS